MREGDQGPSSSVMTWASSRAGIFSALTALALVVLAFVATSGTPVVHTPTADRDLPSVPPLPPRTSTSTPPSASPTSTNGAGSDTGMFVVTVIVSSLLAVIGLFVLFVLVQAVRAGLKARFERKHREAIVAIDVIDSVRQDEPAQQQALREGTPSNAIIACWVRLEHSVADAGVARRPSETSAELALRVLEELETDAGAVHQLSGLYREARFSAHPLTEEHRIEAQRALTAVHAALGRRRRDAGESV